MQTPGKDHTLTVGAADILPVKLGFAEEFIDGIGGWLLSNEILESLEQSYPPVPRTKSS